MTAAKITRFLSGISLFCAAVVCAVFAYSCIFIFLEEGLLPAEVLVPTLIIVILTLLFFFSAKALHSENSLIFIILLLSLISRGAFLFFFDTQPNSDFATLYLAAQSLSKGNLSWLHENYFMLWAYQIPFVVYEAGILKLFGTMTALKIINLFCMLGISLLIYKISRRFVSREAAFSFSVLYTLSPEPLLLSSVLTNQHLSLFLLLLGLYLALHERSPVYAFLGGFLIALGDLMRPEGVLVFAALLFLYLLRVLKSKERRKGAYLRFFMLVASFLSLIFLANLICKSAGLAPYGLNSGCPEWKFILGLDPAQKGSYNETNAAVLSISDEAERKAAALRLISASFPDFGSLASFLRDKTAFFYGSFPDSSWAFGGLKTDGIELFGQPFNKVLRTVNIFDRTLFALLSLMSALSFAAELKPRTKTPSPLLFCAALFLLFFAAYLLIEVQPRYRYFISPFLFILSARTADNLRRLFRRERT